MTSLKYEYIAQSFRPRAKSKHRILLFVAPAGDVRSWAGVPRKAFDYQHGFQRTLSPPRVIDMVKYFRDNPENISPTSLVIGLSAEVKLTPIKQQISDAVDLVRVRIMLPDLSELSMDDLAKRALEKLRLRLPPSTIEEIDSNVEAAVAEAIRLQDEDVVDLTYEEGSDGLETEAQDRSYLADFYAQLLGYTRKLVDWPEPEPLREILYSILKPAIIVDGQHRVFGGAQADESMAFSVCAIPNSSWAENVYQFVVINQKAKPIKPAFLSSIIATSLSPEEIESVYDRLRTSNIDVERAETMERINTDPASPFNGMIDFEVQGSPGFLQFPGMTRLAKAFARIPHTHPALLSGGSWEEIEGDWFEYFFAFWRGIRGYFQERDPRLWQEPTPENPNNLLKLVSLQEMQAFTLDTWADSRMLQLTSPQATEKFASDFWKDFPPTFFTDEWRQKGLQTSVGRKLLRDSITETRRSIGRKNWSHRLLGLFKG